jgi:hypothetical protein
MDIATGVEVECTDGPCGRSRYVILNPVDTTVTHVVVSEPARVAQTHLVPLDFVAGGSPEQIQLKCSQAELQALPQFSNYDLDQAQRPQRTDLPPEMWLSPVEANWPIAGAREHGRLEGQLPIRRGARVAAVDGYIGAVEEFWVEPGSGHITDLIIKKGHLWGRRSVIVPASEIDRIEGKTVFLKIDKARVRALPSFRPGHRSAGADEAAAQPDISPIATPAGEPSIPALIDDLGSSDWATRDTARSALITIGAPAVPGLADALANRERHIRWEAVKILRQINRPAAAPAFVAALEDPGPGIRWIAAEGLAALGRPGVIALLQALVTTPDSPRLRRGARRTLHALGDPRLQQQVAPVLAALQDVEPDLVVPIAAHDVLAVLAGNV